EAYYSASKAAAARFLECLDLEYASKRIRSWPPFQARWTRRFGNQPIGIESKPPSRPIAPAVKERPLPFVNCSRVREQRGSSAGASGSLTSQIGWRLDFTIASSCKNASRQH